MSDACVAAKAARSGPCCIRHAEGHCIAFKFNSFNSLLILAVLFCLLEVYFCFFKTVKYRGALFLRIILFHEVPHVHCCSSFSVSHFSGTESYRCLIIVSVCTCVCAHMHVRMSLGTHVLVRVSVCACVLCL